MMTRRGRVDACVQFGPRCRLSFLQDSHWARVNKLSVQNYYYYCNYYHLLLIIIVTSYFYYYYPGLQGSPVLVPKGAL